MALTQLTSIAGLCTTPPSKEVTVSCLVHGQQKYTTYQRPNGTWPVPSCPVCRREANEKQKVLRVIQTEAKERVLELQRALNIEKPSDFDGPTFGNYVPETQEEAHNLAVCRRFAERFSAREIEREKAHNAQEHDWRKKNAVGLALQGNYGTGKTHLVYAILKELEKQDIPGFYATIPDLFDRFSDRTNPVNVPLVLTKLCTVSCLVLDEVGVQSGNKDERKRLYQIIDGRIKNGRPTIILTNLDRDELNALLTERVMSRIRESTYALTFTGRSRRRSIQDENEEVF